MMIVSKNKNNIITINFEWAEMEVKKNKKSYG